MPFTMPRSTAQITGCCTAASPNGQLSAMIASDPGRDSAWAANPDAGVGRSLDRDLQIPPGGQLVEVVASHVRVELEALGHFGGGHTHVGLPREQIDLAARGVAECAGDGRDGGGELGRREAFLYH